MRQGIENPEDFLLLVWWETLEDHTVGFRESQAFQEWRAILGPHVRLRRPPSCITTSRSEPLQGWGNVIALSGSGDAMRC